MEFTIAAWIFVAVFFGITVVSVLDERHKTGMIVRFSRYLSIQQGPQQAARINTSFQQRIIQPVFEKIQVMISTRLSDTVNKQIRQKLLNAGYPLQTTPAEFLIKNVILWVLGVLAGALLMKYYLNQNWGQTLYFTLIWGILLFVLTKVALEQRIKKRQEQIKKELPEILDYLQVGVEAGLSIDNSVDRIVSEPSKQIMAYEFKLYLHDIKMGLPRAQALQQLYYRTMSESVKNFSDGIIQSVKTGMALGDVLQVIRRDIYESIRTEAEKRAMKAPVVMMFPLIFFIFPTVFIIVVGPTLLILVNEMKKMSH